MATITIVFVALWSCNKDTELVKTTEQSTTDLTKQKILVFKNIVENPENIKAGETMSIDSAVWYIEALLNYTHCIVTKENVNKFCDINIKDSIVITDIDDNYLNTNTVINYFNNFKTKMILALNKIDNTTKFLYLADVEYKDESLILRYYIKTKLDNKNFNNQGYEITDNWEWGFDLGNCSQTILGRDATDEIEKWLSSNRAVMANVYYTDISWEGWFGSYEYDNPIYHNLAPYGVNMFLTGYETNGVPVVTWWYCIEKNDLDNYARQTNKGLDVIESYFLTTNRDITDYNVMEYYHVENNWTSAEIGHRMNIHSGIRHSVGYFD